MNWNYVWVLIVLAWLGWEVWALRNRNDTKHPFTYWVRKTLHLRRGPFSLGWWLGAGLLLWLIWHFLVEGVFL